MSRLEKIVYVADYIEPSRKQAPHLSDIRKLAFRDLDEALFRILKDTLEYLQGIGNTVDQMTQETYDFIRRTGRVQRKETLVTENSIKKEAGIAVMALEDKKQKISE